MTVKEQIRGSEGRCREREINKGLKKKKTQRDRKKDKAEIKTGRYGDPVKL